MEKPKKVDVKLLGSLLIKKNQAVVGPIIERKKNSCISKLRGLFMEEELAIKTTVVRTTEEFTHKIKNTI